MVNFTDEKHLLIDLKDGSFQAFERLYNMYSGKLYNFIMRLSSGNQYMAEEVVQSTFIRIWEVREKVDTNASFISFLCTIAKNLLMNMYQRQTVEYVYNEYQMCIRDSDQLVRFCQMEAVKVSQMAYRLGSMETFMRMVESGKGITFIPELAVAQLTEEQRQLVRPFAIPRPTRQVVLATNRDFIRHSLLCVLKMCIRDR